MKRRRFIQLAAGTVGAHALAQAPEKETAKPILNGIQISPHNFYDEGLEYVLDTLQETAGIDTLFCYTHTYHGGYSRPLDCIADHGKPRRADHGRNWRFCWIQHDPAAFKKTIIGHESPGDQEYAEKDLFSELIPAAHRRGMKVFGRFLEAGARRKHRIPNYDKVVTTDLDGKPGHGPCWHHPDYREWVRATMQDVFRQHPLDGFQYGAERVGPLSDVLFRDIIPACFCEHCNAANRKAGVDPVRAKAGYRRLHTLMQALPEKPADGLISSIFRVFFEYPEVLSWYRNWFKADQDIGRLVTRGIKEIAPSAEVGAHVDHQRSSWDLLYRAGRALRGPARLFRFHQAHPLPGHPWSAHEGMGSEAISPIGHERV